MDVLSVYEYILSRISEDLTPYGYQRSGKSALFYRYSIDKKIGCAFEMQKSINNCTDYYRFTFNIGCICLYDLPGKTEDILTLKTLKCAFCDEIGGLRMGQLCKQGDYWWEITDQTLNKLSLEEYYNRFLHADIVRCAKYLDKQAHKKEEIVAKKKTYSG